jgi:hypothetical protein
MQFLSDILIKGKAFLDNIVSANGSPFKFLVRDTNTGEIKEKDIDIPHSQGEENNINVSDGTGKFKETQLLVEGTKIKNKYDSLQYDSEISIYDDGIINQKALTIDIKADETYLSKRDGSEYTPTHNRSLVTKKWVEEQVQPAQSDMDFWETHTVNQNSNRIYSLNNYITDLSGNFIVTFKLRYVGTVNQDYYITIYRNMTLPLRVLSSQRMFASSLKIDSTGGIVVFDHPNSAVPAVTDFPDNFCVPYITKSGNNIRLNVPNNLIGFNASMTGAVNITLGMKIEKYVAGFVPDLIQK